MNNAALIISILSLAGTIVFAIWNIVNTKKINDINLEAEISKDIIKEYLTDIFPKAVSKIHFKKRVMSGIEPLQNALNDLRKQLIFYKYCDEKFFRGLKEKTQALEDYIVLKEGHRFDYDRQNEIREEVRCQMKEIYQLLKNKYKNG